MIKVIAAEKRKIFDKSRLEKLVEECINLNSNLIVFGLPWSGKSTLIKAICKKSNNFITLEEEEVTEEKDDLELRKDIGSQKWAVGHQFPFNQVESVTKHESIIAYVFAKKSCLKSQTLIV